MKQIFLTPANLAALNLKPETTQEAADAVIADLIAKAGKVDALGAQLSAANTAKETAENALATFKKDNNAKEVKDLIAKGVADKKLTVELGEKLSKKYEGQPTELKELIDAMPAYQGITSTLNSGDANAEDFSKKTWSELDKAGKLPALKAQNIELFKAKYKEQFGKEWKEK